MKKCLFLFSLSLIVSFSTAQDCTPILRDAQQAYNRGQLRTALRKLQDTELCDYDNVLVKQRQDLQRKIFNAIEQQRRDAISAKNEAESARQAAQQEKAKADSALAVANRVLDKLYFYEDKFGLTLKNVAAEYQQPRYRYGFINRLGEEVIPFEFEEASPFSLADGFARIKREGKAYLLDTLGKTYLVATSLAELTPETQALDLHESRPDSLPEHIGNYPKLEILLAYGSNSKAGKLSHLPAPLSRLIKLKVLNLRYNQLTELPTSILELSSLQALNLSENQLNTLPPQFGQLGQLQTLNLRRNQLTALPSQFGQLSQLQELDLYSNQLSQLPPEFGQLGQLQILKLRSNQLSQLPSEFGQLSQLQELDLYDNQLNQLPPEFGQLRQLQELELSYNKLSALPPQFGQLNQLHTLYLVLNQLSQLPPEFGQLSQLQYLYLNVNPLSQLPPEFGQLRRLQFLDLSAIPLIQLPPEFGKLSHLQYLILRGNRLSQLPPELGSLSQLQYLDLSGNQLSQMPSFILQLRQLQTLNLSDNQLSQLSPQFGQLSQLKHLDLSANLLSDSVLAQIRQLLPHSTLLPKSAEMIRAELLAYRHEEVRRNRSQINEVEKALAKGAEINTHALANAYSSLAWLQLLTGQFAEAEASILRGMELNSSDPYLHSNLPHALLFQGKKEAARKRYLKWKAERFGEQGFETFRDAYLADFLVFKEAGVIPSSLEEEVEALKELLKKDD